MSAPRILGACLGTCIHTAGILSFLRLAESLGYEVEFMGPAVPVDRFVARVRETNPDLAVTSYRLSPETAAGLFAELERELASSGPLKVRLACGGTPPVAEVARASGLFETVFCGGESLQAVQDYLGRGDAPREKRPPARTLVERVERQRPLPLLRHHLGLPTMEETVAAAREIADSGELDVLSIAPDQNAQEYLFRPAEMPSSGGGAGGAPIRGPQDMRAIYEATRRGNFPLLRCYAGTRDLLQWARMSHETIEIAWGAIPLFWYSELDMRSSRPLAAAIGENQSVMRWYAGRGVPVEVNDSHQWSLRDAHDAVAVATAYLAAYNAKALGVETYVSQYMLNTPPGTSPAMDLAKMLAKIELIEGLHDDRFTSLREIRTGLRSMPVDPDTARGHLAASVAIGMALGPHIVHVVGYCEADHAAGAAEIIESCRLVRGALNLALKGLPEAARDPALGRRRRRLVSEARRIIEAVRDLGSGSADPLVDPAVLERAVRTGILDAPHLYGSKVAAGSVVTAIVDGRCEAVDPRSGRVLPERRRLLSLSRP